VVAFQGKNPVLMGSGNFQDVGFYGDIVARGLKFLQGDIRFSRVEVFLAKGVYQIGVFFENVFVHSYQAEMAVVKSILEAAKAATENECGRDYFKSDDILELFHLKFFHVFTPSLSANEL
jgi:hypothetical protein